MASLFDQGFAYLPAMQPAQLPEALVAAAASLATMPARAAMAAMAATAPAVSPPPAATPASAWSAPASAPASTTAEAAGTHQKSGFLGNVAKTALHHLSPVARAEAAPLTHEAPTAGADWAIQLGAFRGEAAAEQATSHVAGLAAVKGKPPQVLAPAKHDPDRLYRARLLHFTAKGAQAACAELHRRGIACSVVHPAA
jgi:SPOR domain